MKEKKSHSWSKKSFWGFFIRKRATAWLAIIAIALYGFTSLMSLPQEIQPEIKIPFASVTTVLPGANPSDMELLISKPLEESITNISDIKTLSSTSGLGFSSIFIEFESNVDMDTKLQEVKDAVDLKKSKLPEDATDPIVIKAEANAFSIITFSLISNERTLYELSKIAETVQNELEKITEISKVDISGDQAKYIQVEINQQKIEGYGLDIQTVANLIKLSNNNLPIGIVGSDKINYSIRIDNRYKTLDDLRNLPLFAIGENKTEILLKDIAEVGEELPSQSILNRLSINGKKSRPTVSLQIYKKKDTNIINIAEDSKTLMETLKKNNKIPQDIDIVVTNDNSQFIKEELGNLTRNGLQTALIITIILFLALGFRQGIIAGLSIPLIFMFAFIIMAWQKMTLNTLSLFSLVISLGLMVDTTIIIMEGLHENIKKGMSPKNAALLSIHTFKWPLIAGTMTTIFAFFPMLLVSGILGEFLRTLPITISAALFGSLIISLTLAPAIATKFVKAKKEDDKGSILEPFFEKAGYKFHNIVEFIIKRRFTRITIVLSAITAFVLSLMLPISGILKTEMFPTTDQNYFVIQIETKKGVILEEIDKITKEVEAYLYDISEIDNFLTKIGTSQSGAITDDPFFITGTSNSNLANITINLIEKDQREKTSYEIAKEIRANLKEFNKAKVSIIEITEGPPSEGAITVRITGENIETLKDIAEQIKSIAEKTPGTTNIGLSSKPGLNEFKFELNKNILAYHGLSSLQVSTLIRNIIQGINATSITIEDEDLDIIVEYALNEENGKTNISIHDIENFEIPTPGGYTVTLGQLGTYELTQSLSEITREDQKRIIKVTGDTEKDANITDVTEKIQEGIDKMEIPVRYNIKFGGDLEEIHKSFAELFNSMFIAIILIAFSLVLMFNSFRQPLIILCTLPLALIGVFPGLLLVGLKLSFPAFLGVVALSGIVVNDAIVLIDQININRKNGIPFEKAISEATESRLRPILMTSITTIIGILPLALTNEFWSGLGFSLIFGLTFSTILTLFIIPILYHMFLSPLITTRNPSM